MGYLTSLQLPGITHGGMINNIKQIFVKKIYLLILFLFSNENSVFNHHLDLYSIMAYGNLWYFYYCCFENFFCLHICIQSMGKYFLIINNFPPFLSVIIIIVIWIEYDKQTNKKKGDTPPSKSSLAAIGRRRTLSMEEYVSFWLCFGLVLIG